MKKAPPSDRDGSSKNHAARVMTVGRAVSRKGLDTLVEALSLLPPELHWTWTHIGGGMLEPDIKAMAASMGLSDRISMMGTRAQTEILEYYRESDLFVLPCRIARDGDRDGLPNVLVEAQSQSLACISTPVSGIVELIDDGVNGLLVEPDNPPELARAIERAIRHPSLRAEWATAGLRRVRDNFDSNREIRTLTKLLDCEQPRGLKSAAE